MKVIDLLVDKVNGKKLPNKIKANSIVFILDKDNNEYKREDEDAEEFYTEYMIDGFVDLTDEVEIIEEEPRNIEVCGSLFTKSEYDKLAGIKEDKKIEKLETYDIVGNIFLEDCCFKYIPIDKEKLTANEQVFVNKINEIIDKLEEK